MVLLNYVSISFVSPPTVPHEIVTIETFFSKFSLCAVGKLDIFSERNVFRKHTICEKFLKARLQKSVHIEAWKIILKWFSIVTILCACFFELKNNREIKF